jgi:hypothetical protein
VRETAVVIEVPGAAPLVDGWRQRYTYDAPVGVPAHVTLLYPWVPAERLDTDAEERLAAVVGAAEPFDFVLGRTARFDEPLLYLPPEPPEPFARLTEAIAAEWPEHPPYEGIHETVIPHLTVAHADHEVLDGIAETLAPQLPIEARASEASLLEEGEDGFWQRRRKFLLGAALAAVLALAGCGSGGGGDIAHVGSQPITKKQLDALLDHFRTEAEAEGRSFPKQGTDAYRVQRNELLGLLVYREELRQAAKRLGITVSQDEISKRLAAAGQTGEEQNGDAYADDAIEAQLLTERIFRKVTRRVKAKTPEELSAKRNQVMAAFVAKLQRETRVRYEPGFGPSS